MFARRSLYFSFSTRLFLCLGLWTASLALARSASPGLSIHWIDSEGGGSTLLVTPAGESVLIDSGNPGGRDAARIHHVATQIAGVKRIDHAIITHFHIDHFGGLAELAQLMPIGTLYDKGIPETVPDQGGNQARWALSSRPYRQAKTEKRVVLQTGDRVPLRSLPGSPRLSLTVLAVNQQILPAPDDALPNAEDPTAVPDKPEDRSDNANSLVLLLEFGPFRFFDGGDLTWNVEKRLAYPRNIPGQVDVFQVNHHGLDSSNHPLLVRALAPTVAVMNNGPRKGTSGSAIAALKSVPQLQAWYQVHENIREDRENNPPDSTMIANRGDPGELCDAHPIHCDVSADGQSYTLRVPSTGHSRVYKTRPKQAPGGKAADP